MVNHANPPQAWFPTTSAFRTSTSTDDVFRAVPDSLEVSIAARSPLLTAWNPLRTHDLSTIDGRM